MGVQIEFIGKPGAKLTPSRSQDTPEVPPEVTSGVAAHGEAYVEAHEPMTKVEREILVACAGVPRGTADLLRRMGYSTRTGNFKKALTRLLAVRWLQMTIPDKPVAQSSVIGLQR